jgi:hypothetical protein
LLNYLNKLKHILLIQNHRDCLIYSIYKQIIKHLKQGSVIQITSYFAFKPVRPYYINISNRLKYGPSAPKYSEIFWFKANEVDKILSRLTLLEKYIRRKMYISGKVIKSDWPFCKAFSLGEFMKSKFYKERHWENSLNHEYIDILKIAFCIDHWVNNITWEDTGIYSLMEKLIKYVGGPVDHGIYSRRDIIERYNKLDDIFEQVKKERRLLLQEDISPYYHRRGDAYGLIHIDSKGEIYWGGQGANHRFAIAYILKLTYPAYIGLVHESSVRHLNELRKATYDSVTS